MKYLIIYNLHKYSLHLYLIYIENQNHLNIICLIASVYLPGIEYAENDAHNICQHNCLSNWLEQENYKIT